MTDIEATPNSTNESPFAKAGQSQGQHKAPPIKALSREQADRQRWISALAKASARAVADLFDAIQNKPDWQVIRGPETGLVMVRGRAGGRGMRFNLGEMTMTRCSVRLPDGRIGHSYQAGSDLDKAEQSAVLDALFQDAAYQDVMTKAVARIEAELDQARQTQARKAAATKVDFYTMVRGEDEDQ